MKAIRILKSSLVGLVLGLLSMSAWAQVCGDGGQIVSNGGSLLCVNGSAGTRPYGSHTYDGVGAPSSGAGGSVSRPQPPKVINRYGAVAWGNKTNKFYSSKNESTKTQANAVALAGCGKDCKIISTYANTCTAVAWGVKKNSKGSITLPESDSNLKVAESKALASCNAKANNCQIILSECSKYN
jgi:hypothetical protein